MVIDIRIKFGFTVKYFRKKKKLSQEQLAEKAHLDRTYIGSIERGERNISLVNIERIAKALELEVWELFKMENVKVEQYDN
ncbi:MULTISPECIES: helix-turn-helix domain-containing protein [unclassified Paenibacillus]|uniref:helix-turn-helix domain-containing protein n=1 Tax=unclassified Paenibacillus TaxID=185978 RepID=UPI0027D91B8F|nr:MULTISPECIES: helix-turn-helix transcriptional regulator [unclassified Paenibacillus]